MDKKQINIPKYLWVIIAILLICIIFIFTVQIRFAQEQPKYVRDHESATSQINMYNDYLARASEVSTKNETLKKQYEANSRKLFANAAMSPDDIKEALERFDYEMVSLTINTGVVDTSGRTAVAGEPLYSTSVKYKFIGTEDNIRSTLDYLETQSEGAYFINDIEIGLPMTADTSAPTTGTNVEYEVTLNMNLYYFNDTVAPVKPSSSSASSKKS